MRPHPLLEDPGSPLKRLHPCSQREKRLHDRWFSPLVQRKPVKATVFSVTLLMVTGCSTLSPTLLADQSTQATKPQTAKLNTASLLAQASPLPQASQPFLTDRQNQLNTSGYNEGNEAGRRGLPSTPSIGIGFYKLTDLAEQTIYTNAYNRGYADGKGSLPPTNIPPTNTVSPARRAELQQKGKQEGANDAQPGANLAANPESGIAALGLTDPTEIQIYTAAYTAAYQQASRPQPTKPLTVARLNQLKQQGYNDGYADAQANLPQAPGGSTTYPSLVSVTEQQAYTNSYNAGYQHYLALVQPSPITGALW